MKISITTPSYNQGQYIERTLQSILDQEIHGFDLEYIVVDAVSTDQTDQIVRKYIPKFKAKKIDFLYIREKDNGQSDAINKGWRLSTGDIVTYINSDDYYEPDVLRRVADFMKKHPKAKWTYGGWNLVNKEGRLYKKIQHKSYSYGKLLNYCNIGQPSCFFRRELLHELGYLNEDLGLTMDYDLWLRFSAKYNPQIMRFVISNMRYYAEAKSGNNTKQQLAEGLKLSCQYSRPLSVRRLAQYYYFLRGLAVLLIKKDISRRVDG